MIKRLTDSEKDFTIFAHRGAGGTEPENTLRSFRKAVEFGAKWIELDVQNVENRLMVFHDSCLERTTNGTGRLSRHTVEALRGLDAGKGERIPVLGEVLDAVRGKVGVNIELKGPNTAALTVSLIEENIRNHGWMYSQFIVSSFIRRELSMVKKLQSKIRIGFLYAGAPFLFPKRFVRKLNPASIHLRVDRVSRRFVEALHRDGRKVFVYTVNDPEEGRRLRSIGVDGIFTDFPERFTNKFP